MTEKADRKRGALLGLAVGDALGTTFEFQAIAQPAYPVLATGPAADVVGGGPFALTAGQVTDDTQLAAALAASLHACGGFDVEDVARRYVEWRPHCFDIGGQTSAAIARLARGESPRTAGLAVWRGSGRGAAGNGSLMRTAPLGVALAGSPGLVEAALAESAITHADPRCMLACAAFDAAIAAAVTASTALDGAALVRVARDALAAGGDVLASTWEGDDAVAAATAVRELAGDLEAALADEPGVYQRGLHLHETQGFVRVALRLAFWHAVHTPRWRDALVDVASRGGDADTNAAIVGALLGARDGASAIPAAWRDRVLDATQPGPAAWAAAHHPRQLLALL